MPRGGPAPRLAPCLDWNGLVARLEALAPADFARQARHPWLDVPLRLIDMCLFQADHDDHHLVRIRELRRAWESR